MTTEKRLEKAMLDLYEKTCQETNTPPQYYLGLIRDRGAVEAARYLLSGEPQEGFTKLFLAGKTHLTFESYIVQHPEFNDLIGQNYINIAKKRLNIKI